MQSERTVTVQTKALHFPAQIFPLLSPPHENENQSTQHAFFSIFIACQFPALLSPLQSENKAPSSPGALTLPLPGKFYPQNFSAD